MDLRYRHMCRYVEHAKKKTLHIYVQHKQTNKKKRDL